LKKVGVDVTQEKPRKLTKFLLLSALAAAPDSDNNRVDTSMGVGGYDDVQICRIASVNGPESEIVIVSGRQRTLHKINKFVSFFKRKLKTSLLYQIHLLALGRL
jgi:hypothetical protein